jgi:excisionase family DNA binding protein
MGRNENSVPEHTRDDLEPTIDSELAPDRLPNRLMTVFEVAKFVGCHEETIRRAYLRGLLVSQRFGVRGRRFRPAAVHDWIKRGAPTRVSWQLERSPSNQ